MKLLAAGGFIVLAAGAVYFFGGGQSAPDVYAMPVKQAYDTLRAAKIEPSGTGMYFRLATTVSGNGKNKVVFDGSGSHAHHNCEIALKPAEDPAETHVAVTCKGGGAGDGAAAGMVHNMIRNRVIEMVDATLTGREFDPGRAQGLTAARWPGDGVDGSLGGAMGEALKMEADTRKMIAEVDAQMDAVPVGDEPDTDFGASDGLDSE